MEELADLLAGYEDGLTEGGYVDHGGLLADVSGKGIAASLLTGYMEALSTGPIEEGHDPAVVFTWLSQRLLKRTPSERYATAILAAVAIPGFSGVPKDWKENLHVSKAGMD